MHGYAASGLIGWAAIWLLWLAVAGRAAAQPTPPDVTARPAREPVVARYEALASHVVDLLAEDPEALFAAAEGRVVMVQHQPWRVATESAALVRIEPTARQRLYMALANPVLVYLLLIAGVLGLFIESTSPGLIVPGALGVLALGIDMISAFMKHPRA